MLDTEDIRKLMEVLATKEDVQDLKQDVDGLRESVQALNEEGNQRKTRR